MERINRKIIGQHGAAGGGALTEARPVVDHRQPRAVLGDESELGAVVGVQRQNANPVGVQRAGAVAFTAIDPQTVCAFLDTGTNIKDRFPPGFRQGIGEAIAL